MSFFDLLSIPLISAGVFFLLVGSIGLIRLPDFYSRSHATGKADTLGILLILSGFIILVFVALTNPTATHALARAAFFFGVKPRFKDDSKIKLEK